MKIRSIELFKVPPRWLFLKLTTESGLVGWGEPVVEGKAETVAACVKELAALDAAIVPWEEEGGYTLRRFAQEHPAITTLGIVIGPEGGITPEAIEAMKAAGCQPVTLGPRILRTETAGLAALSAAMCLYGEWG